MCLLYGLIVKYKKNQNTFILLVNLYNQVDWSRIIIFVLQQIKLDVITFLGDNFLMILEVYFAIMKWWLYIFCLLEG